MNRKELFNEVWRAADIMRRDDGTNGINEYIEQISWMFFLKVFEDLEERFKTSATLDGKKYSRIIPEKHSWSKWTNLDTKEILEYIDSELFPYLGKLSGTPEKDIIGIIFSEVRQNKMKSASNLKDVTDIIKKIDFNNEDDSHILSLFYEDLLVKLGKESGIAGEFYTPRPIVKLLVKIINPQLNPKDKKSTRVLDPFCGSCGFLVESFSHIMKSEPSTPDVPIIQQMFYGFEKKSLPFLVGLMNCILHELITPNIERRNSLNENVMKYGPNDKFDYVLTNPPFGGTENKQIQQNYPVKIQATELLALQQVMRRLKLNGQCGIVVPEGILSRGEAFAKVKKELVENYNVHTIISLPAGVFANVTNTGPGPKTNLLCFDKNKTTTEIWYYELVTSDGKSYTKANPLKETDLLDCYSKWEKKKISENSWIVNIEEIKKNNFNLTARNPNKIKKLSYGSPESLIDDILSTEQNIASKLLKIKKLIGST